MNYMELVNELKEHPWPVSQKDIARKLGTTDRKIRKLRMEAQLAGEMICTTKDGKGIWLTKDVAEFRECMDRYVSPMWTAVKHYRDVMARQNKKYESLNFVSTNREMP